jgi:hypothetical protein
LISFSGSSFSRCWTAAFFLNSSKSISNRCWCEEKNKITRKSIEKIVKTDFLVPSNFEIGLLENAIDGVELTSKRQTKNRKT